MKALAVTLLMVTSSFFPTKAWNAWTASHGKASIPDRGLTDIAVAWQHHFRYCGAPKARPVTKNGVTYQTFQHCILAQTHVVYRIATPNPTKVPVPTATKIPVVIPTPIPLPTPVPTPISLNLDCASNVCLVDLLNRIRQYYGVAPLSLNDAMSNGTTTCIGALGHSEHMAQQGFISHDQFPVDLCGGYSSGGENVGMTNVGTEVQNVAWITQQMMNEPHDPATCAATSNHACSILSTHFTRIGIGIYQSGSTWVTETFEG